MLKIRLTRLGAKGNPFYRVVVADSRSPRDGRFVEVLGTFNPMTNPEQINIDKEKALKWIANGAQPTDTARALLEKANIIEKQPCKRVFKKKEDKKED
ncbi:MAG: 30S ribosomal protein S16 [Christensenellales bacterium]